MRITRDEGLATLWRGSLPTVGRAMVLNAAQLGIYGQAKEVVVARGLVREGHRANFAASLVSGFFATAASIPLDMMKTQLQVRPRLDVHFRMWPCVHPNASRACRYAFPYVAMRTSECVARMSMCIFVCGHVHIRMRRSHVHVRFRE